MPASSISLHGHAGAQQSGRAGSQKPAAAGAAVKRMPGSSNTSTASKERPGTLRGPGSAKPPAGRVANTAASFRASPRDDRPATSTSRSSTRPTSCSSATSSTSSLDTRSSDTSTKAAKPQWLQQLKQQQQQQQGSFAAPAQHVIIPGLGSRASLAAATEAAAVSTAAAGEWDRAHSQAGTAGHPDSPRMSGGSCTGKDACQSDSLLHGRYDEAAAASSFQEALQQWRQAAPDCSSSGQGLSTAAGTAGTATAPSSGSNRNLPGATAVAGSCCGTQGDHSSRAGECCCAGTLWQSHPPQILLH